MSPLSNPSLVPPPDVIRLAAEDLAAGYGRHAVLDGVSLDVAAGRFTALVGPNGSGKSTLLSAMSRLLAPMRGVVTLDGKAIHRMPTKALARELGILPQNPLQPEGLSVFDLVSRGRYPHQGLLRQWSDADEAAVERAMRLTGTLEFARRPVDDLSGGQRQRCWIAMAIAQETQTILLDEPTAFLDLRYQVEILDLLHDLTLNHGRTIVAVLHDLNLAVSYADTVVFLKDGAIRGTASPPADCTPALIRDVFGIEVLMVPHPETGGPVFIPRRGGDTA
ncbi:ABC transporter [Azorhizobium oxalatiphilum]|uniref:ABC transporter n=1 Tax=Azorhizobium oxalatiphilum TaxID=980631 RepID=A0A917C5G0_9HYPH|nr:ABC transporter ATP-binding protein [Azorhizobium oxalatiphilum]GGF68786.1 ABC transporter [Azorhizobium oxalatiphilum]